MVGGDVPEILGQSDWKGGREEERSVGRRKGRREVEIPVRHRKGPPSQRSAIAKGHMCTMKYKHDDNTIQVKTQIIIIIMMYN